MKSNLKKGLAMLAAVVLVFTSACSSGNSPSDNSSSSSNNSNEVSGGTDSQEVVTLKVFISSANVPTNIIDNPQMREIEKRIGVKLDFSPYTGGGDAKQKLGTLIAANDLPDLIYNEDMETNNLLLQNGLIMPLDDLIKSHGPELEKNIKPGLDYSRAMFSNENNELFFVPNIVGDENLYPSGYDLVFQIRGDLLKKAGMGDPKNLDELLQFALEANKLEPTTDDGQKTYMTGIPFADLNGFDYIDWNQAHYQGKALVQGFNYLDMETNTLEPRFTDPDNPFWQSMAFYNKAFQLGLLDPESATMNGQQVQDKGKALRYHIGIANWQIGWPNNEIVDNKDMVRGFVPAMLDVRKDFAQLRFSVPVGGTMKISIPKSSKHAEKAMEWLNMAASFEGAELMWNGPEGYTWDWVDGIPKVKPEELTEEEKQIIGKNYLAPLMIVNGQRKNPNGWFTRYGDNSPELWEKGYSEPEKEFMKENNLDFPTQIFDRTEVIVADTSLIDPVVMDSSHSLATNQTKISNYLNANVAKVVYSKTDEEFEAAKTKFIDDLKKLGIDEVMEYYKEGMEANKAKLAQLQQ